MAEELSDIHNQAATESGLAAEYKNDPVLLKYYMRKLPKRSWAGARTQTEKRYTSAIYRMKGGTDPFATSRPTP